jgi:Zn-finger nucleic acid-binding protein
MGDTALSRMDTKHKVLRCPRDKATMEELVEGSTFLDRCPKCGGTFFDQGEMFGALGMHADPSYWDRPECAGGITDAPIHCPRCDGHMLLQTVQHDSDKVEIDRCGHCQGIWLDKGEAERIMAIGAKMGPVIAAERAKAQAELDKMGDVDFRPPSLIARFLALFGKKK